MFKTDITSKNKIKEVLGDIEQKQLVQVEKWWDKYSVSLNDIKVKLNETELTLDNYLKELKYV